MSGGLDSGHSDFIVAGDLEGSGGALSDINPYAEEVENNQWAAGTSVASIPSATSRYPWPEPGGVVLAWRVGQCNITRQKNFAIAYHENAKKHDFNTIRNFTQDADE